MPHLDQKSPRLADIELAAGGRTKQGYATVKGRLSVRGLKHMVVSSACWAAKTNKRGISGLPCCIHDRS